MTSVPTSRRAAIELGDVGLFAYVGDPTRTIGPSRGCAVLDSERLLVGSAAAARARLVPRRLNDQFWERLDRSPLPRPYADGLEHVDLAHAHLAHFAELLLDARNAPDERLDLVLAVPGFWSADQLALLLGVARSADLTVLGLVDQAVAAVSTADLVTTTGSVLYLDQNLHRTTLTLLELEPERLVIRRRVRSLERLGRTQFEQLWARHLSSLFVRRTRFDPRHLAPAEQALFDGLPRWLAEASTAGRANVVLEAGDREHAIEVPAAEWVRPAADLYKEILGLVQTHDRDLPLVVCDGLARLPGLAPALEASGRELVFLAEGAAAAGALASFELIAGQRSGDGALPLVLRLPRTPTEATSPGGSG